MERVWHKHKGARQNQKQRSFPKFPSESSSYTSASVLEDSIACRLERSSLKMVAGAPIKKLLAEEMSKENKSEQRQPGLIAKLMGLDGMPPQHHPLQRKDRHFFGTYKQGSTSFDFEMQNKHRLRRLNKTSISLVEHEFRDVYEIPETIQFEKPRCSKRFSSSKEFFDTTDELNSNKDDLFTNYQQPGSLFHRHLIDIKDATPNTQPSCIQVLKPSKLTICESNNIGWKSDKEGISHVTKTLPTRIVVLKPNLDRMKSTANSVSSTDSFTKSRSEDSREIAREITRRMRKCFRKDPVELASVLIGYAGDESSYSVYESDSGSESEVTILTSRQSFHLSNRKKKKPVESFVNREAKKRLTDRWTMSQRQKGMEVFGKGNSLGEMLSIPDSANSSHPISSMDGWMGLHIQDPTHEGGTSRNRSKLMKERNLRSDTKKLHRSQHMYNSSSDSSEMDCFYQPQMVANKEKRKLFEDTILSSDELAPKKTSAGPSMQTSKAIQDPQEKKFAEDSVPMPCPVTEPQSPGSSKEADHTSPVSVLESSSFTEEPLSGPNCFESVSAGLLELKMQLKLLKMESGSCADDTTTRSQNDNDVQDFEDDSLMASYLTDILIDSCIQDWDLESLISTWYTPECPISYDLFENLEKKYDNDTTWLREERRLLFDRISVCLLEMLEPFTDSYPWLKLGIRKVAGSNMLISEMKWKLEEMLENEEKSTEKEIKVDRDMEWRDFREYIDVIGRELEILLLNELIEEVAFMTIICEGIHNVV